MLVSKDENFDITGPSLSELESLSQLSRMSSWLLLLTLSSSSDDASDPGDNESGDFLDEVAALGGARGDLRGVGGTNVARFGGFGAGGKSSGFGGVGSPPKCRPRPPSLLILRAVLLQYLGKLALYFGSVRQRSFSRCCVADKFTSSLSSRMSLRTSLISGSFILGISRNERGTACWTFCFGRFPKTVKFESVKFESSNFHGTTLKNVGLGFSNSYRPVLSLGPL
jgi:hypothetical protein